MQYLQKMTKEATKDFCLEMIKLSSDYLRIDKEEFWQRCVGYFDRVFEYNREKTLQNHLDELQDLSPFPEDLRGFIHEYNGQGVFQPKHLMCKLATYRDDATKITYEFLFEYDITDPTTEIYYGIKAISDDPKTTAKFEEKVHHIAWEWRDYIRNKDRSQGSTANYYKRHKLTNNAHDGTFWISWVRVESYESLDRALKDLEKKTMKPFLKFRGFNLKKLQLNRFTDVYKWLAETGEIPKDIKDSVRYKLIGEISAKFNINGMPIVTRLDNGRYRFKCSTKQAIIFLSCLFAPDAFDTAFRSENHDGIWHQQGGQKWDNSFIEEVFRDQDLKPLSSIRNNSDSRDFFYDNFESVESIYHP